MTVETCPDCGDPRTANPCANPRCPGTAAARWEAALLVEEQLIVALDADDGTGEFASRRRSLEDDFSAAYQAGASRAWIRGAFKRKLGALGTAIRRQADRGQPARDATLAAQQAADEVRVADIRGRHHAGAPLSLDDFKFLIRQAFDDYDLGPSEICANIDKLLAAVTS